MGHGNFASEVQRKIFSDIYGNNRWGGKPGSYVSGTGSRPDLIGSYVSVLRTLIRRERVTRIAISDAAILR
jgi:hypothetical protein